MLTEAVGPGEAAEVVRDVRECTGISVVWLQD